MNNDEAPSEDAELEDDGKSIIFMDGSEAPEKLRIIGLYGEVDEPKCAELIYSMLVLKEEGKETCEDDKETYKPFECYISTHGGTAVDMFAVYDMMRIIREDCEIHTIGIGKVMSAGVLLLAAGTKGKRKIGANCRVMIHSVSSHHAGSLHELKTELADVEWIQEQKIKALSAETDMSIDTIRELIERKTNVYLTAEDAVKYGIADEII